jgi:hypothetical protein
MRELVEPLVASGELGTFDYALPQAWVDDVYKTLAIFPHGFVWSYPEKSIFGEPFAVTQEAKDILDRYNKAKR